MWHFGFEMGAIFNIISKIRTPEHFCLSFCRGNIHLFHPRQSSRGTRTGTQELLKEFVAGGEESTLAVCFRASA